MICLEGHIDGVVSFFSREYCWSAGFESLYQTRQELWKLTCKSMGYGMISLFACRPGLVFCCGYTQMMIVHIGLLLQKASTIYQELAVVCYKQI